MPGFFDWLLTDPTGADTGYLARLLGITPQGRGSATEGEACSAARRWETPSGVAWQASDPPRAVRASAHRWPRA